MVKFWNEMRKREKMVVLDRIKFAEKHGIGKMSMDEKQRLVKLNKKIEDSKVQ